MSNKIEFDKNGKEIPEKYLFGKIPVYRNEYADWPVWKLFLIALPYAAGMAIFRYFFY